MGLAERHWFENEDVPDVLDLLKEQKPVDPKLVGVNTWICSECGALLGWENITQGGLELVKYKFCSHCRKAVKWDEKPGEDYH